MNLTIKTLKGGKFVVEVEPTNKVGEVKAIVVSIYYLNLMYQYTRWMGILIVHRIFWVQNARIF